MNSYEAKQTARKARFEKYASEAAAENEKANHYADKAASVGTAGISSDVPDAIEKLRAELANIETSQERMKEFNKIIRTNKTKEAQIAALMATGFTADQLVEMMTPDCFGDVCFSSYALSENDADARRVKARIDELEKRSKRKSREKKGNGYTYREDAEENRLMFLFLGNPAEDARSLLKSSSFKWSPFRGAWLHEWNDIGEWEAKSILEVLDKAEAAA